MFRFLTADWGSEKTTVDQHISHVSAATGLPDATKLHSPKRKRESDLADDAASLTSCDTSKRARTESNDEYGSSLVSTQSVSPLLTADPMERARDEIQHHFGLEILLKHNELRLINQEIAKCQAALEQLRRCHLMPYPVNRPTPEQMLQISTGKGSALQMRPDEPVPRWAPPFGVAEGPYARHYAKWLIPDPVFDGIKVDCEKPPRQPTRSRNSFAEERSSRHNNYDMGIAVKGRTGRGSTGQKLQALSNGYPQPKDKAGPCVLKRADGQTVKLVCLDCHRENFSSTQGFINHCRIAHKREFKSHEEAASQSGQPIDPSEVSPTAPEEKTPVAPTPTASKPSSIVHPLARSDISDRAACASLRTKIDETLKLYSKGKLPQIDMVMSESTTSRTKGVPEGADVPDTPFLSSFMRNRKFNGNLKDIVTDAKTRISFEDITPGEESEDFESMLHRNRASQVPTTPSVVVRLPTKSSSSPAMPGSVARPTSKKGHAPHMTLMASPESSPESGKPRSRGILSDDELDMDLDEDNLSPNTFASNNAPSLVSDDGEYDDSDDASSVSHASDVADAESVSDIAEISLDEEHDSQQMRRGSNEVSKAMKLRKDAPKHVSFVSPVKKATRGRGARQTSEM